MIDAYPALDHLATIEQVTLSTGGPGLNMAVDLRMLGAAFPVECSVPSAMTSTPPSSWPNAHGWASIRPESGGCRVPSPHSPMR